MRRIIEVALPAAFAGWEPRPDQIDLALRVAETLDVDGVVVLEAGTGAGKSLGYLVPAAPWAVQNDSPMCVAAPVPGAKMDTISRSVHEHASTPQPPSAEHPMGRHAAI